VPNASVALEGLADAAGAQAPVPAGSTQVSVRDVVVAQFGFVWRLLRHMGVPASEVDDAAQQVFLVASSKLDSVLPGHERSFLYTVAMRVAARARKAGKQRAEREVEPTNIPDGALNPEESLDCAQKKALFHEVLDRMGDNLRAVFILHELERFTMAEIAATLELPPGTVASRLRRAREEFRQQVLRIEARFKEKGGLR
jgi:RNA polymerase sigma-70 factor, ECF subfamily